MVLVESGSKISADKLGLMEMSSRNMSSIMLKLL